MPRPRTAGGATASPLVRRALVPRRTSGARHGTRPSRATGSAHGSSTSRSPASSGWAVPLVAMVGTNMGAGQRDRARRAAWIGAAMATGLTEMIGLGAAAVPYAWRSLFDTDLTMLGAGARPGAPAVAHAGWGLVGPPGCP